MSYQVDSYGNAYFPAGVSVKSIPATTGTQAKVLVPGANGRISSATIAQLVTQSGGNIVSSVFGRTGVVVAKEGDYNTDQITESGGALYFSTSRARKSIFLTTFNTSGPATYDTNTGILNIPQYGSGAASPTNFVPLTRTITINGQTADLSVDRIFSVASMVYPSAGIALSNGVSWEPSITNNSANWNTAYGWGNHAIAGYALDTQVVHITGAETVAGLKTFTSAVKAPNFILSGGTGNTGMYFGHTDRLVLANYGVGGIDFESNGGVINGTLFPTGNWAFSTSAIDDTINRVQVGGYVIATGYRIPSGTASQFLKANGSVDATSYTPTSRTLTINGTAYDLTADRAWTITAYTLPTASTTILGGVKVDGVTITIDANGVISGANTYSLPTATSTILGGVKIGAGVTITSGVISVSTNYEAPITAGTTLQYFRGDKTFQTLPIYTLAGLGGQPLDADLTAIAALAGTSGFLKKTAADTWALDNSTYLTSYTETDPIWISEKANYALKTYVDTSISNLVASAPAALNTLNELALALGSDANFSTTVTTLIGTKEPSITAGTTLQYWRGDKSWQTLPIYTLSGLGGEPTITAGTTSEYWRGDKSWQTLPVYTLSGLGGLPLAGGIMTGAITLKEGLGNGLKFPNDVFGGSGDTAGMRLITRAGESMSLEMYLTNDADDWFNIVVPSDNGAKVNGNTIWHATNLTNLNQLSNGPGYITGYTETDTLSSVTARGASTSTAVVVNNTLTVNNSSHYDSSQFSLDVNGGLLVKNVGKTALFLLINSNPATGGNNAFVQHTVGGTLSSSYATIQGYYGASVTGDTVLKLNPLGGDVLIGTLIGTGTRMVVANANGVVSTQAIPSVSSIAWTSVTGRPTALSQFTNDLGNYGGWITSYTETDTLSTVTSRGASTTSNIVVGNISFQGVGGNSGQSAPGSDYRIYQAPGAWSAPYPDLNIAWHTGISIGAYFGYGGTRFYNNSDMVTETFSVNNGDNHVRVAYNLYVTGTVTGSNLSGTNTGDQTLPTLSSLNGQPQLNGTGFVKAVGTTISYDNSTYYLASNPNLYITSSATSLSLTGNLSVSTGNTTGGGIIFADDGDIVDLNDAYLSLRFSYGVRIFSANKGGSAVITLANTGAITATGTISASNFSGSHSGSSSGTNTGDQTNITGLAGSETLATVTGRGASTSTAVIINNNLAVNTASPYATSVYSLDINGGLLVKNTGRASNITLINADPSGGGNHAFVIHTVSGTLGSSLVDIQGYYGANVTGSTTIRLNPLGGNVTINGYTAYHAGNIPTLNQNTTGSAGSVAWTNVTGRPTTVSSFTNDSGYITSDSTKLPLVGGTLSGNLLFSDSGTTKRGIQGTVGTNDFWFIGGGATASNAGFLEIATGDDGQGASAEPIYVRQYGPGDVLTGTLVRTASLLDASGNTSFPGILSASNLSGTNTGDQTNISGTANYANQLYLRTAGASVYNANTADLGVFSNYYGGGQISNIPDATYGTLYTFGGYNNTQLSLQLWSAINHNSTSSTRTLYFRMGNNLGFQNDWKTLIDSSTIGSQSVSYATSAGSASSATTATTATTASTLSTNASITGLNFSGTFAMVASGASTSNSTGARLSESYGPLWNLSNSATWHYQVINGSHLCGFQAGGGNFGGGNYYGTGDVTAYYSDERLKTKLSTITDAIEKIKSLEGFVYIENDLARSLGYTNEKEQAGVSAQQIQAVLPQAVSLAPFDMQGVPETGEIISKTGENYLTVKYDRIVPLLIEGIKEQQAQIEEMKKEIKELKNK